VLCGVCVPSADVFVLQGLELLLCAEFVGLWEEVSVYMEAEAPYLKGVSYHFVRLLKWSAS